MWRVQLIEGKGEQIIIIFFFTIRSLREKIIDVGTFILRDVDYVLLNHFFIVLFEQ